MTTMFPQIDVQGSARSPITVELVGCSGSARGLCTAHVVIAVTEVGGTKAQRRVQIVTAELDWESSGASAMARLGH
jgi:hypothetical protein